MSLGTTATVSALELSDKTCVALKVFPSSVKCTNTILFVQIKLMLQSLMWVMYSILHMAMIDIYDIFIDVIYMLNTGEYHYNTIIGSHHAG